MFWVDVQVPADLGSLFNLRQYGPTDAKPYKMLGYLEGNAPVHTNRPSLAWGFWELLVRSLPPISSRCGLTWMIVVGE